MSSSKKKKNLVWIDLEMTGLDTEADRIIEIATIVTDSDLETVAEGPVIVIHQSNERLDAMDEWNTRTHGANGLTEKVRQSKVTEQMAEAQTLEFLAQHVANNASPLCGNSICQDRRFLARGMPKLESFVHYRNLDVSSIKELVKRWRPDLVGGFEKKNTHQALDDIRESIEELRYYREHFLKLTA